jgi:hypothetical protein
VFSAAPSSLLPLGRLCDVNEAGWIHFMQRSGPRARLISWRPAMDTDVLVGVIAFLTVATISGSLFHILKNLGR